MTRWDRFLLDAGTVVCSAFATIGAGLIFGYFAASLLGWF